MITKKQSALLSMLLFLWVSYGQETTQIPRIENAVDYPKSPEAAAFLKYGNTPVDLYTGTPNISIPIHTIQGKELSLPLSLTYDASGIRVDQVASSVGLGWNFNYGGVVSRELKGLPDRSNTNVYDKIYEGNVRMLHDLLEANPTMGYFGPYSQAADRNGARVVLENHKAGLADFEADIFNFSINGLSGKIIVDYYTPIGNGKFRAICLNQPNIKVDYELSGNEINKWIIKDEKGNTYTFSHIETTRNSYMGADEEFHYTYVSSWYISKIESPNKIDTLDFVYSIPEIWSEQNLKKREIREHYRIDDCTDGEGGVGNGQQKSAPTNHVLNRPDQSDRGYQITQSHLEHITYNNKIVVSVTNSDNRTDLPGKKRIEDIEILYNGQALKHVSFDYTYFQADPNYEHVIASYNIRLKLDKVIMSSSDPQDTEAHTYEFDYFSENAIASRNSSAQDYWGYFNGQTNNSMLSSNKSLREGFEEVYFGHNPGFVYSGSDRLAHLEYTKRGALSKITYPTGGTTEFVYEGHYRGTVGNYSNSDNLNNVHAGGLRIAEIIDKSDPATPALIRKYTYGFPQIHQRLVFAKAFVENLLNDCTGGRTLQYKMQQYSYNIAPQVEKPVTYTTASEALYEVSTDQFKGRTMYTFYDILHLNMYGYDNNFIRGKIKSKTILDAANTPLEKEEYFYSEENLEPFLIITPLPQYSKNNVCIKHTTENDGFYISIGEQLNNQCVSSSNTVTFSDERAVYSPYAKQRDLLNTKRVKLDRILTTSFRNGLEITKETKQIYNDQDHNLPVEITVQNSDNGLDKTIITYAGDITGATNAVLDLQAQGRTGVAVNVSAHKIDSDNTSQLIAGKEIVFKNWGNNIILPEFIKGSKGTEVSEDRIVYHDYDDKGNVLEVSLPDGTRQMYIWGYDQMYLLARITNASYENIPSELSGIIAQIQQTSNTEASYGTENALRNSLNALRNHPYFQNAEMHTYTYDPLVGVTSITDARGQTIYYTYDGFKRLKNVKNKDLNILSENTYNYKPQN